MKRALLVNKGWADNLGDQVIKYTIEDLLNNNGYKVDFFDFTQTSKTNYISYEKEALKENGRQNKNSLKKKLFGPIVNTKFVRIGLWLIGNRSLFSKKRLSQDYDIIIVGGGQLILGDSSFPYAMYLWTRLLKKLYKNTRLIILGVGAGGEFGVIDSLLYSKSLKKVDKLYIRDNESIEIIKDKFNVSSNYIPDVGFYISKAYKLDYEKEKKVLVGITDYLVHKRYNHDDKTEEDYSEFWEKKIVDYMQKGYKVQLFYTTMRDLVQSIKLKDTMHKKYNIKLEIIYVNTLEELLHEVAKASIIISGRMHGLIIGYAYGCEVVPYIISDKLKSFKEHYLDNNHIKINELQEEIERIIKSEL